MSKRRITANKLRRAPALPLESDLSDKQAANTPATAKQKRKKSLAPRGHVEHVRLVVHKDGSEEISVFGPATADQTEDYGPDDSEIEQGDYEPGSGRLDLGAAAGGTALTRAEEKLLLESSRKSHSAIPNKRPS